MPLSRARTRPLSRALLLTTTLAAATLASTTLTGAAAAPSTSAGPGADVVLDWYDVTAQTVAAAALPAQVTNSRIWAVSWLAADRAITSRPGGHGGSGGHGGPGRKDADFATAAFATAIHDGLAAQVPARTAELDAALAATLADVPDGNDETAGVEAGHRAARALLAERAGDGLDVASVNAPYTPPAEAPGVWRPTPPAYAPAVGSGQGKGRTFLLGPANRFRPGPPDPLGSPAYQRDLAEVRAVGSVDSTVRTAEQTDVAMFWAQSSLTGYTTILRGLVEQERARPLAWQTHLVATFHQVTIDQVTIDAQIAGYEAKYVYTRWRPVTAIRFADTDGDPTTDADPNWTPLIATPAHPEYPSGHATYAGAAQRVLEAFTGSGPARPIAVTSATAPGVTRTYSSWRQATQDNIDARVWEGVHFRHTDETGAQLGRTVAAYDLRRINLR
ncbi:phosphoesterase PA-phosphatase [Frankia sp. CcI49]|uniref:vanadium-dependent haloperoxidase n=1 Tax=Frankia sp. CcI49 TaxID=1745382 RepID=UPI000978C599|nr:vanadium-dependent haloperoxidase [Frankia sp. CcI49]ONH59830.1 phosphoesterase PA-phosphatase [Frankia sp. CcI49]